MVGYWSTMERILRESRPRRENAYRSLPGRIPEVLVFCPSQEDLEDTEGLLPEEKDYVVDKHATRDCACKAFILLACLGSFLMAILVLFVLSGNHHAVRHHMIDDICFEHTNYYSPVIEHIDTTPRLVITNGSLGYPSIWRGKPSEEIDKAWEDISYNMGVFSVPEEIAVKAGVKKGNVRIPAGYSGSGEYMVSLELTHQLHCVNFLRKAAWFNYPIYKGQGMEFMDPDEVLETHLYHCIETLRQVVMCNADTGLIGYRFVKGREKRPYPDFNTPHKCRDWQGMLDFAYAHTIQGHPEEHAFVPGPDEIVWESEP